MTNQAVITDEDRKAACKELAGQADLYFKKLFNEMVLCDLARLTEYYKYMHEHSSEKENSGSYMAVAKALSNLNEINEKIRINKGKITDDIAKDFQAFLNKEKSLVQYTSVFDKHLKDISFINKINAFRVKSNELGVKETALTRIMDALEDFNTGSLPDMKDIAKTIAENKNALETRRPGPAKVFWDLIESFLKKYKFGEPSIKVGVEGARFTQFGENKLKSVGVETEKPISKNKLGNG